MTTQTYKLNPTATTANYGENSPAVLALQQSLNAKGAGLALDSKYGPLTQAAVAKYGTQSADTNTPVPPGTTTPIPTPDTTRFARTANMNDTNINDMEKKLFEANNIPAPDLATITQTKRDNAQTLVDSIRAEFAKTLADQGVANEGLNSRVRALNITSGLGGSDFATASAVGQEKKNQKAMDLITQERDAKINAVYADIDTQASAEYKSQREAYVKGLGDNLTALKAAKDEDRKNALNSITGFAQAGIPVDKLKTSDPETYKFLLEQYGGNQLDLETAWNSALPDQLKTSYSQKMIQGTNGNAIILRYGFNPVTGKTDSKEYDTGVAYNKLASNTTDIKEIDGRLWQVSTDSSGNSVAKPLTEVSEFVKSQTAKNWADAKKTETPTPSFSFSGTQKSQLINANFKDSDISTLQDDIRNFGIVKVLGNPTLSEEQKTAIKKSLAGSDLAQQIAEYMKTEQ